MIKSCQALLLLAVLMLGVGDALAQSPTGFRSTWRQLEGHVNDALAAATAGDLDETRDAMKDASDALFEIGEFTAQIPEDNRAKYQADLNALRVLAQGIQNPQITPDRDAATKASRDALQKLVSARSYVPPQWLETQKACTLRRRQMHLC